jgi:hypothetical protein
VTEQRGRRDDLSDRLVGTWRLVSYTGQGADGRATNEYGANPRGRLIYDKGGRMSVHLADPRRKPFVSGDPLRAAPDEMKDAFAGYFGYFGTYTVDEKAGVVTHHVEEASYPNFAGTNQRRFFTLQGRRLILRTPPVLAGGTEITYVAIWEREA